MIIYQALSTYQILECIEHRKIFHKHEEAVLILGTYIVEKFPYYKKIQEFKFFDNVYLFDFGGVVAQEDKVIETMEKRVKETFPFDFLNVDKIYIAGIHTYLSLYLISKNIRFSMFEDGSGALSRPWVLAEITQKSAPNKYELINKYGLYNHTSELVVEKWCNKNTQIEGFNDEKIKHFDVVEGFEELEEKDKEHLLQFFNVEEKINISRNATLVLTQQFSNLGQLSFEEHINIYQYMFDFYLKDDNHNIVLKLHPDDIMYYEKLFPSISVIREMFPSELLPYVFKNIPDTVVTISSTGIHLIRNKFKNFIEFNELYEKSFVNDPSYYVVEELLKRSNIHIVDCIGVNQTQLVNMMCKNSQKEEQIVIQTADANSGDVLVVDDFDVKDISELQIEKYCMIIYLNSEKKYRMYELQGKDIFTKLIPVEIIINTNDDSDNFISKNNFVIWIETNNIEVKKMCEEFELEKELKNTNAVLNVKKYSKEELEIMRLKGLLEATERRLLDYIKREKELIEELEKLRR